jgi:hypothetical protein
VRGKGACGGGGTSNLAACRGSGRPQIGCGLASQGAVQDGVKHAESHETERETAVQIVLADGKSD